MHDTRKWSQFISESIERGTLSEGRCGFTRLTAIRTFPAQGVKSAKAYLTPATSIQKYYNAQDSDDPTLLTLVHIFPTYHRNHLALVGPTHSRGSPKANHDITMVMGTTPAARHLLSDRSVGNLDLLRQCNAVSCFPAGSGCNLTRPHPAGNRSSSPLACAT